MKKMTDLMIAQKLVNVSLSAKARGIPFDLSIKRVRQLMTRKRCYYTKVKFSTGILERSFDRVNNLLGYTDANVVACTKDINFKKANFTELEITQIYNGIKQFNLKK